jgi:hypothetical protein
MSAFVLVQMGEFVHAQSSRHKLQMDSALLLPEHLCGLDCGAHGAPCLLRSGSGVKGEPESLDLSPQKVRVARKWHTL